MAEQGELFDPQQKEDGAWPELAPGELERNRDAVRAEWSPRERLKRAGMKEWKRAVRVPRVCRVAVEKGT